MSRQKYVNLFWKKMNLLISQREKKITFDYCVASIFICVCLIVNSNLLIAQEESSYLVSKLTKYSDLQLSQKYFSKEICLKGHSECISLKRITKQRVFFVPEVARSNYKYIEFPLVIDHNAINLAIRRYNFDKKQQRLFLQEAADLLNDSSISFFLANTKQYHIDDSLTIHRLPINNSLLIEVKKAASRQTKILPSLDSSKEQGNSTNPVSGTRQPVIAMIDSGISNYHHQLASISVEQFNPANNTTNLQDTGLGHATGILSLLAVAENKEIEQGLIDNGHYLSCNGLPNGKYDFILILKCMNWIFVQPRVDVVLNAWLASEAGCIDEWRYPIAMLFYANTIPVFSSGNYASELLELSTLMSYSPANLDFSQDEFILLTVGALDKNDNKLSNSSFGQSNCSIEHKSSATHYQANIMALGDNLKVAVPFTRSSYQLVTGTSYSIVFVVSSLVELIQAYPHASSSQIVNSIIYSAEDLGEKGLDSKFGYGKLNTKRARKYLQSKL